MRSIICVRVGLMELESGCCTPTPSQRGRRFLSFLLDKDWELWIPMDLPVETPERWVLVPWPSQDNTPVLFTFLCAQDLATWPSSVGLHALWLPGERGVWSVGPWRRWRLSPPSFKVAVGRQGPSITAPVSPACAPTQACGGNGVAAWDRPRQLVFALVSQESPHSRQKGTVGHPREKNHFLCLPCALPTPWYVILLLPFLRITPFCVCHLFLPRAPAHTPGASRGWSSFQSSSLLELTVTKWVIL